MVDNHVFIYIYIYLCVCVCIHTHIHSHTATHRDSHTHICIYIYVYKHTYTARQPHINTHTHTHTHTHTYICICIYIYYVFTHGHVNSGWVKCHLPAVGLYGGFPPLKLQPGFNTLIYVRLYIFIFVGLFKLLVFKGWKWMMTIVSIIPHCPYCNPQLTC